MPGNLSPAGQLLYKPRSWSVGTQVRGSRQNCLCSKWHIYLHPLRLPWFLRHRIPLPLWEHPSAFLTFCSCNFLKPKQLNRYRQLRVSHKQYSPLKRTVPSFHLGRSLNLLWSNANKALRITGNWSMRQRHVSEMQNVYEKLLLDACCSTPIYLWTNHSSRKFRWKFRDLESIFTLCTQAPVSLAVMSSCYGNDNSTSSLFLVPFLLIFPQSLAQITATSS